MDDAAGHKKRSLTHASAPIITSAIARRGNAPAFLSKQRQPDGTLAQIELTATVEMDELRASEAHLGRLLHP
jgi:hypothetical protein